VASKQSSHRLSAVPGSTAKFVEQFLGRPGWLTPRVPLLESVQRLVVVQRESSDEPAANAERVNVTVLPCDGGRYRSEISLCPIEGGNLEWRSKWSNGLLPSRRFHCRRKIFWSIVNVNVPVFDRHKMRLGTFVIEESWEPGVLRHGCGGRIRPQFASELLLQQLDRPRIEAG
jgi:hypothetical protein